MKKFILTLILVLTMTLIILELVIRVFGLAGSTLPNTMINGEYRLTPGSKGTWVKGPQGNIRSSYMVNKQGFNSLIPDYDQDSSQLKIALVGDSYIEGLHVNCENSIGRITEDIYADSRISVHEYGISGWNAHNFLQMANEKQHDYNFIFVLLSDQDLSEKSKSNPKPTVSSLPRKIYDSIHILRYLNINRGIIKRIKEIGPRRIKSKVVNITPTPNYDLTNEFPTNTVFLYEELKLQSLPDRGRFIRVEHVKQPVNFGKVDGHWNLNGRYNCALAIVNFLRENKPTNISADGF